jgi:hypothetical protein
MAVTIANQWTGTFADQDKEIVANPTPGRMLIAVIASRVIDSSAPTLNVGDVSRNGWSLLYDPLKFATSQHAAAQLQVEIWACPAARFDGWTNLFVYASAAQITASDVGSVVLDVIEVAGTTGQITVESVTAATASATTSLGITVPAPAGSANCLMVAAAVADVATAATPSGTGWAALTGVTNTGPVVGMASAWREATTGGTVTFTLGTSQNWAGVAVAIRTVGATPAQPNPNWPASDFQVGFGYDLSTPLPRVVWTSQNKRLKQLDGDRGVDQNSGMPQQGTTTLAIDNRDGAYTPRPAGSATANAAGTTTTIKVPDAQATSIFKGDFFRLAASSGALKQLAVFQVTATASAAGTTTVTFTRADGSGAALAATASGDLYVGIPIDAYIPYRHVMTWNGQPYVFASGWLADIPVVYDGAAYAETQATGTDVLEALTAANLSALRGEIMRRNPTHYWPMDDAPGNGYAANASGRSNAALTQTVSKYGAGANVKADFGGSLQDFEAATGSFFTLIGDPGTGWAQAGQTSAEIAQKGYALVGSGMSDLPPISGGVTIFGVVATTFAQFTTITAGSTDPTLIILRNTDPAAGAQGSVLKLSIDNAAGYAQVTVWDKTTHAATTTTSGSDSLIGNIRVWSLTFNQTSFTVYVDGVSVLSGSANLVSSFSAIDVGGEADQFFHGKCFPAIHAHVAVFGRRITDGEVDALNFSAQTGKPGGETISARIGRKLNTVGWKGARVINGSFTSVSAEDSPSGSVLDIVAEVGGYQDGMVFPDAAGQLQFRDRIVAAQQSPRATLGENTAAGEIPYQPGMSPSYGLARIYNAVAVANTANTFGLENPLTSTLVAVDDTSVRKYNERTLPKATRFVDTYRAWDIAWWWLARSSTPAKRVETVTIEASAEPGRWPFVLGVEVGDIVPVAKRHLGAPPYTVRCQVLRVQPHLSFGDQTTGSVTLALGPAPAPVTVLNDPVAGIVGNTIVGI